MVAPRGCLGSLTTWRLRSETHVERSGERGNQAEAVSSLTALRSHTAILPPPIGERQTGKPGHIVERKAGMPPYRCVLGSGGV